MLVENVPYEIDIKHEIGLKFEVNEERRND